MVNFNGTLTDNKQLLSIDNRGFAYGDAVFETIKVVKTKVLFWEDHYFRLMASMRILRMEIPMNFTMEYLEAEILKTIEAHNLQEETTRVKLMVYREGGGRYLPETNSVSFSITAQKLESASFRLNIDTYRVDIYKDFPVAPGLMSTLKTNNRIINVVGSVYAQENNLDNCILINTNKQVVEVLNGNVFLVNGNTVKTPPILDGCLKGIMRKQILEIVKELDGYTLEEASISPFEIQKADEMFITNTIVGIQSVTNYRKKEFKTAVASRLVEELNRKALG